MTSRPSTFPLKQSLISLQPRSVHLYRWMELSIRQFKLAIPALPSGLTILILGRQRRENFNVVLFHKVQRACGGLDEGAEISVSYNSYDCPETGYLDNSPDRQYTVWVATAEHPSSADHVQDDATLRFSSLEVRYVKAVKYETLPSSIPRLTAEK